MKELNDYLEAKGVSTHLKVKRSLAQAFGLPMDNGTPEQQSALLRALQAGEIASIGETTQAFRVEVAFKENATGDFGTHQEAKDYAKAVNTVCRISKIITISQIL